MKKKKIFDVLRPVKRESQLQRNGAKAKLNLIHWLWCISLFMIEEIWRPSHECSAGTETVNRTTADKTAQTDSSI